MSRTEKTATYLGVAVVLIGAAVFASIPRSSTVDDFRDQGQPFFPGFRDPALCTSLEVMEVDPATAEAQIFKVMRRDGQWVIPSHFDYPADAKDRLARTAAEVMDLTKDTVRSSRSQDHDLLGVLDPSDAKLSNINGLGKKITLRDGDDRVLAEYIIGKDVPNRPGQKYVRRPGQVRTYGVNLKAETSVQFADWIEPNLLDLQQSAIRRVSFDNRKVDPRRRKVLPGDVFAIHRSADGAPWLLDDLPPDKALDPAKTTALLTALADLKIVGIRPKPSGLAAILSGSVNEPVDDSGFRSLVANGFYPTENGLLSDEGTLTVGCEDGVVYKLQFGRVNYAKGEALSAGKGEVAADGAKTKSAGEAKDQGVESRFLFVTTTIDPAFLTSPKGPVTSSDGLPVPIFQRNGREILEQTAQIQREIATWNSKKSLAEARVKSLSKRFAPWYYLVPGDDYRLLVLDRRQLVREKAPEAPPGQDAGFPTPDRSRSPFSPFSPGKRPHG